MRDLHAPELLADSSVYAVRLGRSYDRPGQAAILLFVNGQVPNELSVLPTSLDGVPTRVIEGQAWAYRGLLSGEETAQLLENVAEPQLVHALRAGEMERASVAHAANKDALLKLPSVLGVGITSSIDAPGEAALLIYVRHGTTPESTPAEIDGVRTRIRETGPFVAGRDESGPAKNCMMQAAPSKQRGKTSR